MGCAHVLKYAGGFDSAIVRQHPQKVRFVCFGEADRFDSSKMFSLLSTASIRKESTSVI